MGWYCYLDEEIQFPFTAVCMERRATSPLRVRDEVEVLKMAPEDECRHEMFVMMPWEGAGLAVPLSQLRPIRATDMATQQAVADWHYWAAMGYVF